MIQRIAPGVPFQTWIEQQWLAFSRRFGYRTRNGAAHAHFDRWLERQHPAPEGATQ